MREEADPNAPDYRHGFLRLPLPLFLALYCRSPLTRRQLQIVSYVIRESWGWRSPSGAAKPWTRPLSTRDFARATGLSTDRLARDLRDLAGRGVLREREGRYQLVPYPHRWALTPPKARPAAPESPASAADSSPRGEADR